MSRRQIIASTAALILFLAVLWLCFKPALTPSSTLAKSGVSAALEENGQSAKLPVDPKSNQEKREPDRESLKKMADAFRAPISFYGKVVDERGDPVVDAAVRLETVDKPFGEASVYTRTSDASGRFSLEGARGSSVSLWLEKPGYYSTAASKGRFVYGGVRGGDEPVNPTPESPAVFVLRRMGETVPLHAVDRDVVIPKDGSPVEVSLRTGRAVQKGQGDLVVECWTHNEGMDPNRNEPYDWRLRLTVPNGGLLERVGEFAFIAPADGYRPSEEVNMSRAEKGWRSAFQREYFIKTGAGTFSRINLRMATGGGHFVTIKAYLNPTAGSRNLEFSPAKAIQP